MDAITTRIFIDNVFLILQRRNIPGITLGSLRLAGEEFQELCKTKDVKTDIRLSGDDLNDLLENSDVVESQPGNPSYLRVKPGAAMGRKYAEYLPLRATVALVMDLPGIVERVMDGEEPRKSA